MVLACRSLVITSRLFLGKDHANEADTFLCSVETNEPSFCVYQGTLAGFVIDLCVWQTVL